MIILSLKIKKTSIVVTLFRTTFLFKVLVIYSRFSGYLHGSKIITTTIINIKWSEVYYDRILLKEFTHFPTPKKERRFSKKDSLFLPLITLFSKLILHLIKFIGNVTKLSSYSVFVCPQKSTLVTNILVTIWRMGKYTENGGVFMIMWLTKMLKKKKKITTSRSHLFLGQFRGKGWGGKIEQWSPLSP